MYYMTEDQASAGIQTTRLQPGIAQLVNNAGLHEILLTLWNLGTVSGEPLTEGVTEDAHLQHHESH